MAIDLCRETDEPVLVFSIVNAAQLRSLDGFSVVVARSLLPSLVVLLSLFGAVSGEVAFFSTSKTSAFSGQFGTLSIS